jgi:hypothetical protein
MGYINALTSESGTSVATLPGCKKKNNLLIKEMSMLA